MGVVDVELGRLHHRLVGGDRRLVLGDQRHLVGDLLLGDRILLGELLIAGEVALGLAQQRLVLGQLPLRLGERRLIGARIDLGDEVARLDGLALGEPDALQGAGDLGADGHGLERRHRAEGVDGQRHVAEGHRRDPDGLRRVRRPARAFLPVRGRGVMLEPLPGVGARRGQDGDDRDPGETAPPAPRSGFDGRGGHALRDLVRRGRRAFRDVVRFKGLVHP